MINQAAELQPVSLTSVDQVFELGKLHCDRGDYESAMSFLGQAAHTFFAQKNFSSYLKCQNLFLRIYAERERYDEINTTKEQLQDLVLKEGFELNAKTYYTLSLCAGYKSQHEVALDYAQRSLSLALSADDKEDICNSIFMISFIYFLMGRYPDALKEVYNLHVFFQVYNFPELRLSAKLLNADIFRIQKKFDEALDIMWEAYEELKECKKIVSHISILGMLGTTYFDMGDKESSRLYLNMAMRMVDSRNQVRLSHMIKGYLDKMGGEVQSNFDVLFDESNHLVVEQKIGRIDFKNQFILLDLLKLFIQNQGVIFSKEYLVENVWKQPYDPGVHDNKIYVTIKRLRKLIEPEYDKPKYLFRAKNGYYFNKAVKVHFEI
ncbi:MAG: winged helix-turn-helix domain-containing protein [Bdellovibrionaceae bacterium]|nr:winged helix-turn-helix domain-containing protein [Pseudobdellovibrionaceae bacterium]